MAKTPAWVLRFLRSVPNLKVHAGQDRIVRIRAPGGESALFLLQWKRRVPVEAARTFVRQHRRKRHKQQLLLATHRLTEESRSVLREAGVSWLERDTGVVHLQGPGLLIEGSWPTPPDATEDEPLYRPTKLAGKSGIVAETLLCMYRRRLIQTRELADHAGVSAAMASRVLTRLEHDGIIATEGSHAHKRRKLINPAALLDAWQAEEQTDQWVRHGLYAWAQTVEDLYARLQILDEHKIEWALSHTSAASLYAPTLTRRPDPEVWVHAGLPLKSVAEAVDGELVETGANFYVWQSSDDSSFLHARRHRWPKGRVFPTVSPYRAYIEAYDQGARSQEVALRLRQQLELSATEPAS